MEDLGAIHEPVPFNWEVADALVARLNAGAGLLRAQRSRRTELAGKARTDWRGVYEGKFGARMTVCVTDAGRLADAMELAAKQVQELAQLAREEQQRREVAKQYERDLKAWQERRDNRNPLEVGFDGVTEAFGADDGKPRPPDGPKSKRVLTADAPNPAGRE
ncbi:MAG: hypothetical protein QOD83_3741 [Solirubrobacteraceae bacterium]|jgi:hypothetical protein|nr:hypothetical protein [Solirubrobacteraceae bacterium]